MSLGIRFTAGTTSKTFTVNGRSYTINANSYLDIAYPDALLVEQGVATPLMVSGNTTDRPSLSAPGLAGYPLPSVMYDITLAKPIFIVPNSNPTSWTDITGASA